MSTPAQLLTTKLAGTAARLARERGSIASAVSELQRLAAGRGDLLAQAAGTWSTRPDTETGNTPLAAGLLILASADLDALPEWYETGRRRALAPRHGAPIT